MALCKQSSDFYDENPAQAHIIAHSFTLLFAPRTFRPAPSGILTTLAALVYCTLSHAQIIHSTYILAVDRCVQEIDAVQGHGLSTNAHRAFPC